MERTVDAELPGSQEQIFAAVADLTTYPDWMELVTRVQLDGPVPGDSGPAYLVDIRARMGPLQRTKRLRMVRSVHEPHERVRFERCQVDGRDHATWRLDATVGTGTLRMSLYYGGALWGRALDLVLGEKIESGVARLEQRLAD